MPPRNTRQHSNELEEYAQKYFKYSLLIQEQTNAIQHLPNEVNDAHAIVTTEHQELEKHSPKSELTLEELQKMLQYYEHVCETPPLKP